MMTSTFDKIYSNAQNMNIETSEWFNRAGFTENRYIHGVNSQYDCTGCLFTEWFKVFRRRGRWYAYHCIGMDI